MIPADGIVFGPQLKFAPPQCERFPGIERNLRVYAIDPSLRCNAAQMSTLSIPFERLETGKLAGARLEIGRVPGPFGGREPLLEVDLDAPEYAAQDGLKPDCGNPQFVRQMVYAVAAWTLDRFRHALGREPDFSVDEKLLLEPFHIEDDESYYLYDEHIVSFGWMRAVRGYPGAVQPGSLIFAALSHDTIVHETTHALLDGVHPNFVCETNEDVGAFREGFSDLIAVLAHFAHEPLVRDAFARGAGIDDPRLVEYGRQRGREASGTGALRNVRFSVADIADETPSRISYSNVADTWRGLLLAAAVYEAFRTAFLYKTERWRRLREASACPLVRETLIDLLVAEAQSVAMHFLRIAIRALDYLPPLDVKYGDYLRAMITADRDLVPDDPCNYREALIYAFRRYGIPVDGVEVLSENALLWQCADRNAISSQSLKELAKFPVTGKGASSADVRKARGEVVRRFLLANHDKLHLLGLMTPGQDGAHEIVIENVRALAAVGPKGRLVLSFVVKLLQFRDTADLRNHAGGCTLIVDADGELHYVIRKDIADPDRLEEAKRYLYGKGAEYLSPLQHSYWFEVRKAFTGAIRKANRRQ